MCDDVLIKHLLGYLVIWLFRIFVVFGRFQLSCSAYPSRAVSYLPRLNTVHIVVIHIVANFVCLSATVFVPVFAFHSDQQPAASSQSQSQSEKRKAKAKATAAAAPACVLLQSCCARVHFSGHLESICVYYVDRQGQNNSEFNRIKNY